jgi:hypothetical protein
VSRAEKLARYCGPAVIASVLGITREQAAERLLEHEPSSRGAFYSSALRKVAGLPPGSTYQPRGEPTLARWLREDGRDAMILVSTHFVHVSGGEVVEDNGLPKRRGRVRAVTLLPRDLST